jgi:hypothetical protein
VNRIVEYIMQCVFKSDFPSLQSFWSYLYGRFFSQMNSESLTMAYRLETNVLRLFLVQASKTGRHEEVRAFFEKMSDSLHDRKEWKDWFALPFTKNPDQHPTFRLYYSKEWLDTFQITLHNFFSTLFTSIPLPALLSFEAEHQKMQALSTENHHLHNQLAETRRAFTELELTNQKLEARLAQQAATQAINVSSKRRHSAGKADKLQGKVPAGVASRKKPSTPAYAAAAPGGKRPVQTAKETAPERTEKTSVTPTAESQPLSRSSTKDSFEVSFTPAPAGPSANRSEVQGSKAETVKQANTELRAKDEGSVVPHAGLFELSAHPVLLWTRLVCLWVCFRCRWELSVPAGATGVLSGPLCPHHPLQVLTQRHSGGQRRHRRQNDGVGSKQVQYDGHH